MSAATLAVALLLAGCWDRTEIEDAAYGSSMGVDAAGDEFLWTFQVVEPAGLPGGMLSIPPRPAGPESGLESAEAGCPLFLHWRPTEK